LDSKKLDSIVEKKGESETIEILKRDSRVLDKYYCLLENSLNDFKGQKERTCEIKNMMRVLNALMMLIVKKIEKFK